MVILYVLDGSFHVNTRHTYFSALPNLFWCELVFTILTYDISSSIPYKLMQGWIHQGCGHPNWCSSLNGGGGGLGVENKLKKKIQDKYKSQNFAPAVSNFSETNQLIFIYNSKIGKKSKYLGE